jgi:hypothetical protein
MPATAAITFAKRAAPSMRRTQSRPPNDMPSRRSCAPSSPFRRSRSWSRNPFWRTPSAVRPSKSVGPPHDQSRIGHRAVTEPARRNRRTGRPVSSRARRSGCGRQGASRHGSVADVWHRSLLASPLT